VAEVNEAVSIRVAFDGKTARATTNRFDDEASRAVQSAESIARVQEPDPDFLFLWRMPTRVREQKDRRDGPTRLLPSLSSSCRRRRQNCCCCEENKLVTAGIYSSSQSAEAVINSKGLSVYHRQTSAEVSITMLAEKLPDGRKRTRRM